jgi:two-component sensor histidine kinase
MKLLLAILVWILPVGTGFAIPPDSREIKKLYQEGFGLINQDMHKADSLISYAWGESVRTGDAAGIADGYFYKGCLFDRQMKIDSAILYLNKANSLYTLMDNMENVPDSYGRLGLLLIKKNQRQEGLKHLLEALKLAEEQGNLKSYVRNTIVLAMHHNDYTGFYDEAIEHLKKAEVSARALKDRNLLGQIYLQLSISYRSKGDYEKAIEQSQKSLQEFRVVKSTYNQMRALFTLAQVYEETQRTDEVLKVLRQVEPLLSENADDLMEANYYKLLSEALYQNEKYEEALIHAERAAELLSKGGQTMGVHLMEEMLFRLNYLLGNRAAGDSLYSKFITTNDSIFSLETAALDAEMREKYASERRTQEVAYKDLELTNAKYMRQGLLGFLVFAVLLCVVIYGRLREKAKNERLLGLKNEKIERQYVSLRQMNEYNETLLREIHHRVKNNLQIISSLFSIQARNIQHPEVLNLIEKSKSRLKTISIIHNTLYSQKSLSKIKISDFIKEIGESLFDIYNVESSFLDTLNLNISGESIYLNADTSLPIGLVVNELITNSLKYAFVESSIVNRAESGYEYSDVIEENRVHSIDVTVNRVSSSQYALTYTDSGPGIPDDIDIQTSKTTGLRLIRGLLQQLGGSIEYRRDETGHAFVIYFSEAD